MSSELATNDSKAKREVLRPLPDAKLVRHTRRCNGRDVCSCMLRVESAYFQKNLTGKAAKKRRVESTNANASASTSTGSAVVVASQNKLHKYQRVTNLQQLSFELKQYLASFMAPVALGRLGMTNKAFKRDVEVLAERATSEFLADAPLEKLLKQEKPKAKESWSHFMHNQMTTLQGKVLWRILSYFSMTDRVLYSYRLPMYDALCMYLPGASAARD
ncbi:hypothetical protein BBO99_00001485 [Phytophthora kernoviae]|uniref:Uncharacterized protein n=2 Tax=Phytophthora kernoviae TaxID=325452 RepID=A0A3R7K2V9_9STRA|nr:hypothetical protein G195_003153 [Phytophthora kernoviae 00238/432]KAG2529139.1 hypothetical protein JM16_002149 [Phytophthora kernoviae]KAG2532364.1 hypothetical protein JM18_001263 [Phytophthora kernoviae]RLN43848.1 hypothetical protein BBI17_001202 [Phytophthora kernoviae]RLN84273.1 hypothetical protein BBO99_00001485 [Phytophthora kernoviae]